MPLPLGFAEAVGSWVSLLHSARAVLPGPPAVRAMHVHVYRRAVLSDIDISFRIDVEGLSARRTEGHALGVIRHPYSVHLVRGENLITPSHADASICYFINPPVCTGLLTLPRRPLLNVHTPGDRRNCSV